MKYYYFSKYLFIEKAKTEELELRREVSRLRGQKESFLVEYRGLLEKHLRLLTADLGAPNTRKKEENAISSDQIGE